MLRLTLTLRWSILAHNMPSRLLPTWQRLHPHPFLSASLQTPLQHIHHFVLPCAYAQYVLGSGAVECRCASDVDRSGQDERAGDEDAMGCVLVSILGLNAAFNSDIGSRAMLTRSVIFIGS